ncbi:Disease resistance protein [Melia azedarach]|uniref:Disease resistance protein n=1 Tax=Melia azedarach TaxID=155640 RepID=A0ACC1Y2D9_MELAZ|nr:Disease resistance protein [Melia azedarach]
MATDALLQTLTDKIFTALLNQAQFAIDFRDQFEAMKTKLELIKAFLSSTDNLRSRENDLKLFLPNLRKLIYEADDTLTDCLGRDEYQKERSCWSSSPHGGILFRYKTGKKLRQINSRIEKIEMSMGAYLRPQLTIKPGNCTYRSIAYSSQDYDPYEKIGLENDMEKIKTWIFRSNEKLNRVGIVGMGGLGKTTLAQTIFKDRDIGTRFEKRIWLTASQNFNEERIMRDMLKKLGVQDDSTLDANHLLYEIHRTLGDKSYLIVMDDVWNMNIGWCEKLFPTSKNSFVIVTSRDEEVTMRMGVHISRIHRPKTLNEEESWLLFSKFAFSTCSGKCPNDHFERVGRDVLEKCGGLPLAIKSIGALLASKIHSADEWERINDSFHKLTTEGNTSEVMASLQLSYDDLPSVLKQCLLCFSIYPEDFNISGEQIVHWWVGEGLVEADQDRETAVELGFQYLSELVSRCLVEVVHRRGYDGRVYSCKMHDLVRDMTIKIAKDEAFCSFDEQGKQRFREDSRWLGFTTDMSISSLKITAKLRALIMMSGNPVTLDRKLALLCSLRVLDFSDMKLDRNEARYLWKWICSLKRIAVLNLSGISDVKEVPSSIQKLYNLQILVLRRCSNLAEIHPSITNLKKLIVLDLGFCALKYQPHGLGKLVHLQELSGFRVVNPAITRCCGLLELLKLEQLRVLRMSINNDSEISENELDVLSKFEKLQVLAIDAEECKENIVPEVLNKLSTPPNLKELYFKRYHHRTLPKWMNPRKLSKLKYLCLENGYVNNFKTSPEFYDHQDNSVSRWIFEGLYMKQMPNLELDWEILQRDVPSLNYAEICQCFKLQNFPYPTSQPIVWKKYQD